MGRRKTSEMRAAHGSGCGTAFLILFGLPFAAVGLSMAWVVFSVFASSLAMRDWVETPTRVTRAELAHQDEMSRVIAEYEYDHAGVRYRGSKVSLHSGSDNVGNFQDRVYRTLREQRENGEPFRCFVNPRAPHESIVFRDPRWEMIAFEEIGILFFGGFGGALLVGVGMVSRDGRRRSRLAAAHPNEPWRWRDDWARGQVRDSGDARRKIVVIAAVFWNLATAPLWWLLPPEIMNENAWALIAAILPAIGAGLAIHALQMSRYCLRFGLSVFHLQDMRGVIGGELVGAIETARAVDMADGCHVVLRCERKIITRDSEGSSTQKQEVWCAAQTVMPERALTGGEESSIPVRFAIPDHWRPSEHSGDDRIEWRLTATALTPAGKFHADFVVPVFETDRSRRCTITKWMND